ncbi:hypothetical protein EJB05_31311, partial [Eragrostis curvula]
LLGFTMEVIETASTIDVSNCPDGIICVGGDGFVNVVSSDPIFLSYIRKTDLEAYFLLVLDTSAPPGIYENRDLDSSCLKKNVHIHHADLFNGLLGRDNLNEAIQLPIGIIPAGSDNSLVWTVLGIRDPVSAANAVAKMCLTASYFGSVADVVQLSEKFRLQFGPFRYFLSLPKYKFEVDYLPSSQGRDPELNPLTDKCHEQLSGCGKVMRGVPKKKGSFFAFFHAITFANLPRGYCLQLLHLKAQHDDGNLDLILVRGSGRLRLFCFFIAYQLCWHLLLHFVEYVKVKQVKIRPVGGTHNGCGVDGELLRAEGQAEWQCSLLPAQGRLLGRHPRTLSHLKHSA